MTLKEYSEARKSGNIMIRIADPDPAAVALRTK